MLAEKNILIVDDEVGVRQTLKRGIHRRFNKENTRVNICEAGNGKEAIELAHNFSPDLIIMDIRMPIMDGLKACSILRSDSKFASTVIIMLTCEITEESAGLLSGADEYVIKPFDIKTLLIRIERGLFNPIAMGRAAYAETDGILTKNYFVESWLGYEISRAKRYQHSLSLLLVKIESTNNNKTKEEHQEQALSFLNHRDSDPLIKWADNTYALLLVETCADDALVLAERIISSAEQSSDHMRPSVGIANLEDTLTDDLIVNAEYSLAASTCTGQVVLNRLAVNP
ncbi:response regulator [Colwelliaceae bacterium MEBiC 14330]